MASEIVVRAARAGEAGALTALCVRSKAHWGCDAEFMRLSQALLTVSEADIESGRTLPLYEYDLETARRLLSSEP